jgi:acetolactate synthase regulatory subunit
MPTLVIGNKCHSSWSLRPWILMRQLGVPFDEVLVPFTDPIDTPEWKAEVRKYSGGGQGAGPGRRQRRRLGLACHHGVHGRDAARPPRVAARTGGAGHGPLVSAEMHSGFAPALRLPDEPRQEVREKDRGAASPGTSPSPRSGATAASASAAGRSCSGVLGRRRHVRAVVTRLDTYSIRLLGAAPNGRDLAPAFRMARGGARRDVDRPEDEGRRGTIATCRAGKSRQPDGMHRDENPLIPTPPRVEPVNRHTLAVIVDNEPGVLARISGLFSGRGYNIESLTVTETEHQQHISRITIVTTGTDAVIEQIKAQLERLVPVHRVVDLTVQGEAMERELCLVKVVGKARTGSRPCGSPPRSAPGRSTRP